MSTYDKRRVFKLYSDGKNYILTSQQIENEKLLLKITQNENKLYLNTIKTSLILNTSDLPIEFTDCASFINIK